ncbi:MAG: hypothetical protein IH999_06330 [Proteobacteria bacterium]|nr:hypothetical protein [Pseudomonadota bacterium]
MKKVLIITEQYDPMADILIGELRRRDQTYIRWNLDNFPLTSSLTYRISASGLGGLLTSDGRTVDLRDIRSVWCRIFRPDGFPQNLSPDERRFAQIEAEIALYALPTVTEWRWINHPHSQRVASSKPAQLFTARQLGLEIPRTVISNDPDEIRAFCASCGPQVIYKASSQSMDLDPGKAIFTDEVTVRELQNLDLIKHSPGIFQELVTKAYEIRATVIDKKIFGVKIRSQDKEETKLDWRKASLDIEYEAIDLAKDLEEKILIFMKKFGLIYSSMDFIVTPDGRYIFLESNPGGQYMWAEAATGLPITAALADALTTNG